MEIQFTRIRKDFLTIEIEPDAISALLDAHHVGDTLGNSVSDRLWAADTYSATHDAFWTALAGQTSVQTVDTETDWTLDEEDSEEDESDDDDEDDDSDNEDEDDTSDLSALLIDA